MNNIPILILAKRSAEYMVMRNRIADVFQVQFNSIRFVTNRFQVKGLASCVVIECDGWESIRPETRLPIEGEIKAIWGRGGFNLWLKENDIGRQLYCAKG